jgi:sulfite exporter TauE/SafE
VGLIRALSYLDCTLSVAVQRSNEKIWGSSPNFAVRWLFFVNLAGSQDAKILEETLFLGMFLGNLPLELVYQVKLKALLIKYHHPTH